MKKLWFIGSVLLIFIVIVFLIKDRALQGAANYLEIEETADESDIIIVLGGELKGERTKRAVELYEKGLAKRLVFSDGTHLSWRTKAVEEMTAYAHKLGLPDEAIYTEEQSRSTYENAVYTKKMLLKNEWNSAVIVTTSWHTRRSYFVFEKVYKGTGIKLTYAAASDERIDSLKNWWQDGEKQQIVLTEWAKLITYWIKY